MTGAVYFVRRNWRPLIFLGASTAVYSFGGYHGGAWGVVSVLGATWTALMVAIPR